MVEELPIVHLEDLPHYVYCDVPNCEARHYLSVSRNIQGRWTIGYIDFDTSMACLYVNDAETIGEAALRMQYSLERHNYNADIQSS